MARGGEFLINKEPTENERARITAALMALGTNIGLKKMEQAVKGISYKQMSNVVNWRMSDDNMEKAMADITNRGTATIHVKTGHFPFYVIN